MAKYQVIGSCFIHAGEIIKDATSVKEAKAHADTMKKTILKDLRVPQDGSATVETYKVVGKDYQRIDRERVEW